MIKPWIFEFFNAEPDARLRDDPAVVHDRFRKYIDLWTEDDSLGWEGIFFSEHHFGPGYSPSPNLVISNLAPRTKNLRLGVLGMVSAYATPWRVAEEFAMLDHFTGGRLEMGVVSGILPELAVVGVGRERALEVHAEVLSTLLSAIGEPLVSHQGKHFAYDNIRITPRFLQAAPNVWTAAVSPDSARRAGERGLKMCTAFRDVEELTGVVKAYHDGARSAGRSTGPDDVAVRRRVMIAPSEAEVHETAAAIRANSKEFIRTSLEALRLPDTGEHDPGKDELIWGTAEQVADEIIRQCKLIGAGNFLASFNIFDMDKLRENHRMFGREVIPRLRDTQIA